MTSLLSQKPSFDYGTYWCISEAAAIKAPQRGNKRSRIGYLIFLLKGLNICHIKTDFTASIFFGMCNVMRREAKTTKALLYTLPILWL